METNVTHVAQFLTAHKNRVGYNQLSAYRSGLAKFLPPPKVGPKLADQALIKPILKWSYKKYPPRAPLREVWPIEEIIKIWEIQTPKKIHIKRVVL